MDLIHVNQISIAIKFFRELDTIIKYPNENKIIILTKECGEIECSQLSVEFSTSQFKLKERIFNLVREILDDENLDNNINFFANVQKILPLIEIICADWDDNIKITNEDVPNIKSNILKEENSIRAVVDLTTTKPQSRFPEPTNLNIYYRENEIHKFLFKVQEINLENSDQMIIEEQDGKLKESDENYIITFFHNLRAFLGTLICQIYFMTGKIKQECSSDIILGRKETYYGKLQMFNFPELFSLIREVRAKEIEFTMKNMTIHSYHDPFGYFNSDLEIFLWSDYLANIQPMLDKLLDSDMFINEIDNFLLLILLSYENRINPSGREMMEFQKDLVIKCVETCKEIVKTETLIEKKFNEWPLFYWNKIILMNSSVNIWILNEHQFKVLNFITERLTLLESCDRITDYSKRLDHKTFNQSEFVNFNNMLDKDIKKLSNLNKFISHTEWSEDCYLSVQETTKNIFNVLNSIQTFKQVINDKN